MDDKFQNLKVMVIDDSKTIRRTAETLLQREGCEVVTAVDGFEALSKIAEANPDIVFVDIMMPRLDGYQTCALIKNSQVKVVCTTDDPISTLSYHELLAKEEKDFKVLPALRPDHLISITDGHFADYLTELSAVSGIEIKGFKTTVFF